MNQPRDEVTRLEHPAMLSRLEDPAMIARVVALLLSYGFRWPPPASTDQPDDLAEAA
jgi:hypothetical protein